jgi:hypothetical protein
MFDADSTVPRMTEESAPLLSIVVATRNDDHGGDPLQRLQAFVNTFAAQCTRSGLEAEIIVVEWNPPADRPRVRELLRVPSSAPFAVRFVEVPADVHVAFRFGAVLPLFQMIAKNVGIRRARGRFVLATNIDIIFSNALVDWLASGQLAPQRLYRVNRHDIEADFPVDAGLETQLAYCRTHQIRVHRRDGTHAVDSLGREALLNPDIALPEGIALGEGWHPREGDAEGGFFRWAGREVRFTIDRQPRDASGLALDVDVETNPYQPESWVDLDIRDGERPLARKRVAGRSRLRFELDPDSLHEIVMRTVDSSGGREWLPLFQNREQLCYRVRDVRLRRIPSHVYDSALWHRARWSPTLLVRHGKAGVEIASDREYPYCARYGPFEAPADGVYEFVVEYVRGEGHLAFFARDEQRDSLLSLTVDEIDRDDSQLFSLALVLKGGVKFSLFLANDRPDLGVCRCVIRTLSGSVPLASLRRTDLLARFASVGRAAGAATEALSTPVRWLKRMAASIVLLTGRGLHQTIVEKSERVRNLEARVASLTPLADLAPLARLLKEHRPPNLHQNACGDFQLMAREHWSALRGYPEFEMFSMSIDGLMESLACAAGIREQILEAPLCIYHLEHQKGSGWTPEGEVLLKKRIAESGITWLDSHIVDIWTAYMLWLNRPIVFNGSGWGLGDVTLAETTLRHVAGRSA